MHVYYHIISCVKLGRFHSSNFMVMQEFVLKSDVVPFFWDMLLRNGEHRPFLEVPIMCLVYVDFNTTLIL